MCPDAIDSGEGGAHMSEGKYCVIQDPAGAVAALIDTGEEQG